MKFLNHNHREFNIAHFQGTSSEVFTKFLDDIKSRNLEVLPEDITLLSIWTTDEKCILYQQLKNNNIEIVNGYIPREEKWSNPYKITCILEALKNIKTKYTIILDGYDVVINSWDHIIEKFLNYNAGVVFNTSKNNYPPYFGDVVDSGNISKFKYLNAGCCIGYTDKLIDFYNEVADYYEKHPTNKWNSEQLIVRNVYSKYCKYSSDYNLVKLDLDCDIFQTFGQMMYKERKDYIIIY